MKGKYLIAYFLGVILLFVILLAPSAEDSYYEEVTEESSSITTMAETTTDTTTTKATITTVTTETTTTTTTTKATTTTTETTTTKATTTTTKPTTTTETTTTTTEATTTTTTTAYAIVLNSNFKEPDYVLLDRESMTVHNKDCPCINMEAAQKIYGCEKGFFIDEGRPCSKCKPIVAIGHVYIPDDSCLELTNLNEITYYGNYNYRPVKGASGRELISYFSAASSVIPLGTYVYVKSDNGVIDACFRIDDTGCKYNVIDLYYETYDLVQPKLREAGRISTKVWIIKDPK